MNKALFSAVFFLLGFAPLAVSDDADSLVARVNGKAITRGELDARAAMEVSKRGKRTADIPSSYKATWDWHVLDLMVSEKIMREAVADAGVAPDPGKIAAAIEKLKERAGSDAAFSEMLANWRLTEAELRDELGLDLAIDKLLSQRYTPEMLKSPAGAQIKSEFVNKMRELADVQILISEPIDPRFTPSPAVGLSLGATNLTTRTGKEYSGVTLSRVEPDAIVITHSDGITKIPFVELSEEVQKRLNYDPRKAAEHIAAKEAAEVRARAKFEKVQEQAAVERAQRQRVDQIRRSLAVPPAPSLPKIMPGNSMYAQTFTSLELREGAQRLASYAATISSLRARLQATKQQNPTLDLLQEEAQIAAAEAYLQTAQQSLSQLADHATKQQLINELNQPRTYQMYDEYGRPIGEVKSKPGF